MFKRGDFYIRPTYTYPPFDEVIQSWYSPLLLEEINEDDGLSACVTLGIAKEEAMHSPDKSKRPIKEPRVILASMVTGKIDDTVTLGKHVKCLYNDYLNKSTTLNDSVRNAHIVLFSAKQKENNKILDDFNIPNLKRFYHEFQGGATLENSVNIALPFVKKIALTNMPNTLQLRPDDEQLMTLLLAYPTPYAYAIVSAFTQAILYLRANNVLRDEKTKMEDTTPKHGFYSTE